MASKQEDRLPVSENFMNHIGYAAPLQLQTFLKLRECCSPGRRQHWSLRGLQEKLSYASPERISSMTEEYILDILRNHFSQKDSVSNEMGIIWQQYCKTIQENAAKRRETSKQ